MKVLVLLAGVMLLVYGVATLTGGRTASHSRTTPHSTTYGALTVAAGAVGVIAALVWIVV